MNHESKRPITVEDIIRLKRAERPPAEFWNEFDRELRAKQLAALVEKTPWWRTVPRALAGLTRYSLPLGATAVLAITFVATRDYRSVTPAAAATGDTAVASRASNDVSLSLGAESPRQVAASQATPDVPFQVVESYASEASEQASPPRQTRLFAASGNIAPAAAEDQNASEEISPSARHIAANLAIAQAGAPALTSGLLGATRSFDEPTNVGRAIEPLAQVSTPAERSRARFATAMVASFSGDSRGRAASANVARRISDERVYDDDAIRRVGATGNSVAWRF